MVILGDTLALQFSSSLLIPEIHHMFITDSKYTLVSFSFTLPRYILQ
jgi:hypothetical protein